MPIDRTPWTDDTLMPWGKHKGTKMIEVPGDYLYWLSEQKWILDWPGLHAYLKKNADIIEEEAAKVDQERQQTEGYESYDDYRRDVRD